MTADPELGQLSILPRVQPDELVERVKSEHKPIASVCLFSGGHDSTVLAHRCREHYDFLAFIDTGTAVPGVREFVQSFATWIGKPLRMLESGDAYRRIVLGLDKPHLDAWGFPDQAGHNRVYNALKQPQIRKLSQELKAGDNRARVIALTGIRRAESTRRKARAPVQRDGSLFYVNPLIDWTGAEMRAYRVAHGVPESDVAALLHRSGECNCGCFSGPDDRAELETFWPEWFEQTFGALERECRERGLQSRRWGEHKERGGVDAADAGPMCSDCQLRLAVADGALDSELAN